jgi:hypothetical protein
VVLSVVLGLALPKFAAYRASAGADSAAQDAATGPVGSVAGEPVAEEEMPT